MKTINLINLDREVEEILKRIRLACDLASVECHEGKLIITLRLTSRDAKVLLALIGSRLTELEGEGPSEQ